MNQNSFVLPTEKLAAFCRKWQIDEMSLFGSVLRSDFRPDSDVDLLVSFFPNAKWSLLDHIRMEEELSAILGRRVDLVNKRAIDRSDNWLRRKTILDSAEVIYVER